MYFFIAKHSEENPETEKSRIDMVLKCCTEKSDMV